MAKKSKLEEEFPVKPKQYYKRISEGLAMRVLPSAVRTWLFIYTIAGKRYQMSLGEYPETSKKEANERLIDVRKVLKDGTDPKECGFTWHRNPERERRKVEKNLIEPEIKAEEDLQNITVAAAS